MQLLSHDFCSSVSPEGDWSFSVSKDQQWAQVYLPDLIIGTCWQKLALDCEIGFP